jgi:hypothetical protein
LQIPVVVVVVVVLVLKSRTELGTTQQQISQQLGVCKPMGSR